MWYTQIKQMTIKCVRYVMATELFEHVVQAMVIFSFMETITYWYVACMGLFLFPLEQTH